MLLFMESVEQVKAWLDEARAELKKGTEDSLSQAESLGRNALKAMLKLGEAVEKKDLARAYLVLGHILLERNDSGRGNHREALWLLEAAQENFVRFGERDTKLELQQTRRLLLICHCGPGDTAIRQEVPAVANI
jgi:hypothetical protein